jgi:hypothetical protein
MCNGLAISLHVEIFSGDKSEIEQLSTTPSKCSEKKTTRKGVTRSFIP